MAACRQAAKQIADEVGEQIAGRTTVSVERSVTRLLGVDGADSLEVPLPNVLVDHVHDAGRPRPGDRALARQRDACRPSAARSRSLRR